MEEVSRHLPQRADALIKSTRRDPEVREALVLGTQPHRHGSCPCPLQDILYLPSTILQGTRASSKPDDEEIGLSFLPLPSTILQGTRASSKPDDEEIGLSFLPLPSTILQGTRASSKPDDEEIGLSFPKFLSLPNTILQGTNASSIPDDEEMGPSMSLPGTVDPFKPNIMLDWSNSISVGSFISSGQILCTSETSLKEHAIANPMLERRVIIGSDGCTRIFVRTEGKQHAQKLITMVGGFHDAGLCLQHLSQ